MNKYVITVYEREKGNSQIEKWVQMLNKGRRSNSSAILTKFYYQICCLEYQGSRLEEPIIRKLKNTVLYEFHANQYNIIIGSMKENEFILLHSYLRKKGFSQYNVSQANNELYKEYNKEKEDKVSSTELKDAIAISDEKKILLENMAYLAAVRVERELSRDEIAEKAGFTPAQVVRLECGSAVPNYKSLQRYAAALGLKMDIAFSESES